MDQRDKTLKELKTKLDIIDEERKGLMLDFYNHSLEMLLYKMINSTEEDLLNSDTDKPEHNLLQLALTYDTDIPRKIDNISFIMDCNNFGGCETFNIGEIFRESDDVIFFQFDFDGEGKYYVNGDVNEVYEIDLESSYTLDDIKKIAQFIEFEKIIFLDDSDNLFGEKIYSHQLTKYVGG